MDARTAAGDVIRARDLLDLAIEHYDRGLRLDLHGFFPSSNLPFLYRERGDEGDDQRAAIAAHVARLAAERDAQSEWNKPTLLTLAFFDQDVRRAQAYAKEVRRPGTAAWKVDSTIRTLERSVSQTADGETRKALESILEELKSLLA